SAQKRPLRSRSRREGSLRISFSFSLWGEVIIARERKRAPAGRPGSDRLAGLRSGERDLPGGGKASEGAPGGSHRPGSKPEPRGPRQHRPQAEAARASSQMPANASGSRTAKSASILRLTSIPAAPSPWLSSEYV